MSLDLDIIEIYIIGSWNYDIHFDDCAICRQSLMEKCIECTHNNLLETCRVEWGNCNHIYHSHCISKWSKTKNTCPLCNAEWVCSKTA